MMMVWVTCAGSAGAMARFVVDGAIRSRHTSAFPWATVLINVTGSFLLGLLTGLALYHGLPNAILLIVGVGFCGAYTTFSTASFETVRLFQQQRYAAGAANAIGTALVALLAGGVGLALAGM